MGETFMATYGPIWKSTSHTTLPTSTLWNTGLKLIQKEDDLVSHQSPFKGTEDDPLP